MDIHDVFYILRGHASINKVSGFLDHNLIHFNSLQTYKHTFYSTLQPTSYKNRDNIIHFQI